MKKYLINGAMALIVGGFIVSCSHDDISQPATVDQMTKSFDEMFTELYGPIAPNHNWGFETVLAETGEEEATEETTEEATEEKASTRSAERAATRADVTVETSSDYPTRHSKEYYNNIFNNLTASGKSFEFVSSGSDDSFMFSVIYAHTSANEEIGCYYYNPESEVPTGDHKVSCLGDIQDKDNGIGKYVKVTTRKLLSVFDSGWDPMDPKVGEGKWNDEYIWYDEKKSGYVAAVAQTFTVDVPAGYRVGFYIKNKNDNNVLYTNASLNSNGSKPATYYNSKIVGFEDNTDKTDYHDIIIEVISGGTVKEITKKASYEETTTTETREFKQIVDLGRVFVEDIATAYMKVTDDIDYNDIVFDARVWRIWNQIDTKVNGKITKTIEETNVKYQYDINLLATGGTIEEKVGIDEKEKEVDVHDAFGVGQAFMVNTWTPNCNKSLSGQWNTKAFDPVEYSYTLENVKGEVGLNTIPIKLRYNTKEMINLSSKVIGENGETASAPYKLCLPVGTPWPIERRRIDHAYPNFVKYVNNPDIDFTKDQNGDSLYLAPTSTIQKEQAKGYIKGWTNHPDNGKIINTKSEDYYIVWKGNVTKDQTPIILYDYDFKAGQTIRFYGEGSISVVCGPGSTKELFSNKNMSENGYVEVQIEDNYIASLLSQGILVQKASKDSNFKLTKIVVF